VRGLEDLPRLETLYVENNPWQLPPVSVMETGDRSGEGLQEKLGAIRRFFGELDAHGATKSRRFMFMLAGTGMAGKTSTFFGMKHGEPRPTAEADRTVQLDIRQLSFGEPPAAEGGEDTRIVGSGYDLAGQKGYAAGQLQYMVEGSLYLLLVPAHRAVEAEYEEVLGRWLDSMHARAPGAVVQIVLSHADKCEPAPASFEPAALAAAAAPKLEWIKEKLAEHRERAAEAHKARAERAKASGAAVPPLRLLRVQDEIKCVCAAEGGGASLLGLYEQVKAIVYAEPPLLPSVGAVVPRTWQPALALIPALRDGRDPLPAARQAYGESEAASSPAAAAAAAASAASRLASSSSMPAT
jgi:hypothetical protein